MKTTFLDFEQPIAELEGKIEALRFQQGESAVDISDEIECGPHLDEDLIEAEDDSGAFKLLLETEEDVVTLEESRYMISRPLCLCAESADLLEQGLRVFPGLALYDGTWEQEDAVISYFETKYGMIRL